MEQLIQPREIEHKHLSRILDYKVSLCSKNELLAECRELMLGMRKSTEKRGEESLGTLTEEESF